MAIMYERGKGITKRTGADAAKHAVKTGVKKVLNIIPNALARKRQGDARRELGEIERGFGSVEKYEQLYPETRKRHEELRRIAGY